jgi:F-type H+-transporting ATPase subunit epsilon
MAEAKSIQCVVVTPERAVLDERCSFIAIPLYDGELGVAPGRLPLIGRLGFGELRLVTAAGTQRYYIDGGFVQTRDNTVTILTPRAVKAEDIKIPAVEETLKAAQKPTASEEAIEASLKTQERARAQLRIAKKESPAV